MVSETQRAVLQEMAEGVVLFLADRGNRAWLHCSLPACHNIMHMTGNHRTTVRVTTVSALRWQDNIEQEPGQGDDMRKPIVYRLTPAGREALK